MQTGSNGPVRDEFSLMGRLRPRDASSYDSRMPTTSSVRDGSSTYSSNTLTPSGMVPFTSSNAYDKRSYHDIIERLDSMIAVMGKDAGGYHTTNVLGKRRRERDRPAENLRPVSARDLNNSLNLIIAGLEQQRKGLERRVREDAAAGFYQPNGS